MAFEGSAGYPNILPYKAAQRAPRIFVSYRRRAPADARLAQILKGGFERADCEVFIDVDMPVGVDWSAVIQKQIHWCDYLVVLLSENAMQSEMLQGEVRLAYQDQKKDGRPRILPVRVQYEGPLDYELESYLGRLQYVVWQKDADDERVLCAVLTSIKTGTDLPIIQKELKPAQGQSDFRPRPAADLRILRQPTGTIQLNDQFYIRRSVDDTVESFGSIPGMTLVIKGPRQVGKSSVLVRYLAACEAANKQFVLIDLQSASPREVEELPSFLRYIAERVFRRAGVETTAIPELTNPGSLGDLLEMKVLEGLHGKPFVIAFDEVDRLVGSPIRETCVAMFRHWHNRRAEPGSQWTNVDLALAIATEPAVLMSDPTQSPFNVGEIVRLESFEKHALQQLNDLYSAGLIDAQLDQLLQLLGGHPYLTRLAFYRLVGHQKISFDALIERAADEDGPFGEHLRSRLLLLHQAQLESAMSEVVLQRMTLKKDRLTFYRLQSAGFVRREADKVVPSNLLYARFFKTIL